mmetsp:Transcript_40764/g.79997  ORF Transcript_40764/g.79997 Transcript_40764/m.79997 type:complete len:272 (-) Transcript_40764:298-1113(-)
MSVHYGRSKQTVRHENGPHQAARRPLPTTKRQMVAQPHGAHKKSPIDLRAQIVEVMCAAPSADPAEKVAIAYQYCKLLLECKSLRENDNLLRKIFCPELMSLCVDIISSADPLSYIGLRLLRSLAVFPQFPKHAEEASLLPLLSGLLRGARKVVLLYRELLLLLQVLALHNKHTLKLFRAAPAIAAILGKALENDRDQSDPFPYRTLVLQVLVPLTVIGKARQHMLKVGIPKVLDSLNSETNPILRFSPQERQCVSQLHSMLRPKSNGGLK